MKIECNDRLWDKIVDFSKRQPDSPFTTCDESAKIEVFVNENDSGDYIYPQYDKKYLFKFTSLWPLSAEELPISQLVPLGEIFDTTEFAIIEDLRLSEPIVSNEEKQKEEALKLIEVLAADIDRLYKGTIEEDIHISFSDHLRVSMNAIYKYVWERNMSKLSKIDQVKEVMTRYSKQVDNLCIRCATTREKDRLDERTLKLISQIINGTD